jgi:hypothetical protein
MNSEPPILKFLYGRLFLFLFRYTSFDLINPLDRQMLERELSIFAAINPRASPPTLCLPPKYSGKPASNVAPNFGKAYATGRII